MSTPKKPIPNNFLFLFGGTSGMAASCVVHPLNLIKIRMQVSGQRGQKVSPFAVLSDLLKNEGIRGGLYRGLSANLMRQATYSTSRLGFYSWLFNVVKNPDDSPPDFPVKVTIATLAGFCGSFVSTPPDLILIRTTADGLLPPNERRNYTHVGNAMVRIVKEEGVRMLWRGCILNMLRGSVHTGTQLATYSQSKEMILATNKFEDDVLVYVMASLLSVLATAITSLPIDIIKTRVQNMKTVNGVPEHSGAIDAFGKLIRKEGILSLWKGILPFLARSGPHGIITFVVFEKLQNTYRNFYM